MQRKSYSRILALGTCATGLLVASAQAAKIEFRPVDGVGNAITVPAGSQVTLEVFVSGWSPSLLQAYQGKLDVTGYQSGGGTDLSSFDQFACANNAQCEAELGTGAPCDPPGYYNSPPKHCAPAFIDITRADYVFDGVANLDGTDVSVPHFRWGATILPPAGAPVADPGVSRYGGTLVVDVPAGAAGTYTIGFDPEVNTSFFVDENNQFIDLDLVPATITIGVPPSGDIPTVSEWGLAIMAVLLLIGAKVYFTRRRAMQL